MNDGVDGFIQNVRCTISLVRCLLRDGVYSPTPKTTKLVVVCNHKYTYVHTFFLSFFRRI